MRHAAGESEFVWWNCGSAGTASGRQSFVVLRSFFLIGVSCGGGGAEAQLSGGVDFSSRFGCRPPGVFLVSFLQVAFGHSCVRCASSEWHHMI